ncbi:MAG TPA: S8 family peptidase [Candidatus Krumholzibacteria bacterium]|nr:S8 family peptidase [Candidatus Krumholzibacteria bacterium]HPD70894.1 S8 family peptidase [Candidatus Krumholzibacteria bacterium]HRY39406.1 S8 family peptidase [Candidatus Krumholzibacteria bacterium]
MNLKMSAMIVALGLALVCGMPDQIAASETGAAAGRVVVSFESGLALAVDTVAGAPRTGIAALDAVLARHGAVRLEPLFGGMIESFADPAVREDLARHYVLVHADKAGSEALNAELRALPFVEDAVTDVPMRQHGTAYLPNDIQSNQWHLRNLSLGGGDTRAVGGWAESLGDSNVVVAVLDSGIDWHHPDLGGTHPDEVNGSIWTNWTEYHGTAGVDDDGNGYVDDIRGWDYVNVTSVEVFPGEDYGPPDNDPMDFGGHGTLVAGCVAPITDNGTGIAAIAPGCKIMAVRIGWLTPAGEGVAYPSYMAQAFVYATANGADIINLSYSTGYTPAFASAITAALNAGLVICVSAGNDDSSDAGYLQGLADDRILAVAASNSGDAKADFSNYGTWVDLTAPGTNIYTTSYSYQSGQSGYLATQGTSFSSPIAAGACALIWSAHPEFSSAQVAALVQSSCDDIDSVNPGYEGLLGAGRVNLLKALGDNVQQVPAEFLVLQDAVQEAAPGDTIKVRASHALGAATLLGKGLQVLGGYADDYSARDPLGTPTVITGNPNNPGLQFVGPVDQTCVVDGFRVQGGGGRIFSDIPYAGRYGGGVMLNTTSPTLRNLFVTGNSAGSTNELGLGGGIALHNSQAVLENVTVTANTATYGAGVFVYRGAPTFTGVVVDGNTLITDDLSHPPLGGGLHVIDADVTLTEVSVTGHLNADKGGGLYLDGINSAASLTMNGGSVSGNTARVAGAGIFMDGGSLDLAGVELTGNVRSPAATFLNGGALAVTGATVTLDGVTCDQNEAHAGAGAQFGGCPSVAITGSVFTRNTGALFAGNLYLSACTIATITNVTIADNQCPSGGAGLYAVTTPITVSNTISAFNTGAGATANGMYISGGAATLSCNDVFGNAGAAYGGVADPTGTNGNIALDPQFCDRVANDYRVNPAGPCAPAQSGGCDLIGALEAVCGVVNAVDDPVVPVAFRVDANFPNPFNPTTTIRFAIPASARTQVVVYDVRGRLVKTLIDEVLPAATHSVQWRGDDARGREAAAGIYVYKVTSGEHAAVGRMALIK